MENNLLAEEQWESKFGFLLLILCSKNESMTQEGKNMKKYKIIYADCPWEYDNPYNYGRKHTKVPYPTMKTSELMQLPLSEIANEDCALFMWATHPKMKDAFNVIEGWGFKHITTAFVWVKTNRNEKSLFKGLGYWTNSNTEICLFAKKGHPKRKSKTVKQVIIAPRGQHSAKPPQIRDRIVKLMGDIPRIELFARQQAEGWDAIGNEIDGKDIRKSLRELYENKAA